MPISTTHATSLIAAIIRISNKTCGTGKMPVRMTGWKPVPHGVLLGSLSMLLTAFCPLAVSPHANAQQSQPADPIYTYTLAHDASANSYDESAAVACLQGIMNRDKPRLYVLSKKDTRPEYWLKILTDKDRWLKDKTFKPLPDLNTIVELARPGLKGAVIWDPQVPASFNVATTIAGVEDAIVLSPEYANKHLADWKLNVLADLRGRFTGKETGSKKNDAYRWAIREYLDKGRCSNHFLCLYEDTFSTRARGDIGYVLTRDWAVKQRAFVYDLSPWGDEVPSDDPDQKLGTDLATYKLMLEAIFKHSAPNQTTEVVGFFAFTKYSNMPGHKSAHDPVPTEWETVWLISPYNCYQNTVASDCFNQTFHSQAPFKPLKQRRPADAPKLANQAYVCILMADYDSATPLYSFLPNYWDDPKRGQAPFAWGINPNLIETYPDIIAYLYETATANDYFTADASAAGYMNPNRIKKEYLPLFVKHNKHFFQQADMTIAPMVLDWDQPTAEVKDAFTEFAPDGFATIVLDYHQQGGKHPTPHVWKGMPVTILINSVGQITNTQQAADMLYASIKHKPQDAPGFFFFRIVWNSPTQVIDSIATLREKHPELLFELVDPYTFFRLFKQHIGTDSDSTANSASRPSKNAVTQTQPSSTTATPKQSKNKATPSSLNPKRINQIASMLRPAPAIPGIPITDRTTWEQLRRIPEYQAVISMAESLLSSPLPEQPDELYLEFSRNGNRTNFQDVAKNRRDRITHLTLAECLENKGRFLPTIEELVNALCAERTWVLPAHDRGLANFKGTEINVDLASSALAYELATLDYLVGPRLRSSVRATIRENVMRRVVEPYQKMIRGQRRHDWWLSSTNNWNAVCLAGATGAALYMLETPRDRAEIIAAAENYSKHFLAGFTSDGYCSEGLSYWVYGFGHYAMLSELVRYATGGAIDLLARPEAAMPARFPQRIEIINGISPAFADCSINAKPHSALMWMLNKRLSLDLHDYATIPWEAAINRLPFTMIYTLLNREESPPTTTAPANAVNHDNLRTWFDQAGVLICRPARNSLTRMGAALKGGNNAEHHNHNDIGSYVVVCGKQIMLVDPGSEVYTERTFSPRRYESKLLNSFGHPVPVVAGKLQVQGKQAQAKILQAEFSNDADILRLDISSAYDCKELLELDRSFTYSRKCAGSVTISDRVVFSDPRSFATALITLGQYEQLDQHTLLITKDDEKVRIIIDTGEQPFSLDVDRIEEDAHAKPIRISINLIRPVVNATVSVKIAAEH